MSFPQNVTRLCGKKRFSFGCHPNVPCFTECCRELELALTPYDVLCLRKELRMSSTDFIDHFVVVEQDERSGFPKLFLGMVDDGRASCPFISERGCRVYNNRPGACRAYPVGRGVTLDEDGNTHETHVLIREEHCQGFTESTTHDVNEWFKNQGLDAYNKMNDEVLTLLQHEKVRKGARLSPEQNDKLMLILYKVDEFRKALSIPGSVPGLQLNEEETATALADDTSLLQFGIRWLRKTLFTEEI